MKFPKKNFLLLGYQVASLNNLKSALKINCSGKLKLLNSKTFKYKEVNKIFNKKSIRFEKILKLYKNYNIILGTSEFRLESNLANFFNKNNINFYCYVDSNVNMKIRFTNYLEFPNKIIALNKIVVDKIKKEFPSKIKKIKFYDLKMPYQKNLKKKYSNLKRKNNEILYLTNDIGLKNEKSNIYKILKKEIKKVNIQVHPRESKSLWIKQFLNNKQISVHQNLNFYKSLDIKKVYGVSTMALINYKFAGFNVFYIDDISLKKNPIMKFMKFYKIKKIKI
jgi:hypothetical protein